MSERAIKVLSGFHEAAMAAFVCPLDCCLEGPEMLVIQMNECIDC